MRKAKNAESDNQEIQVRLKPVFGIAPGTYLTVLYTLILLVLLFLLLFYPGLKKRGTFVSVESSPPSAIVRVDGAYAGTTPCTILVPPGTHTLGIEKPFFRTREHEDVFSGRVFGTLFAKPRQSYVFDLELPDPAALLDYALKDFAANPHIPEIITDTVQAGYNAGDLAEKAVYYDYLDNVKYFITNTLQLSRVVESSASLASGGGVLTAGALRELTAVWIRQLERYDNLPFWLLFCLPAETARSLAGTSWFEQFLIRYRAAQTGTAQNGIAQSGAVTSSPPPAASLRLRGLRFVAVPAGVLQQGFSENGTVTPQLAHNVSLAGFYMAETEVSNRLYHDFTDANPRWKKSNLESLLEEKLVAGSYLEGWENDRYPAAAADLPVVNVSFAAAEAFCRWLGTSSAALPTGYSVRLPYESEWEYAARGGLPALPYPAGRDPGSSWFYREGSTGPQPVGFSEANGYGLRDMSGNVWEWCADWFSPMRYFFTSWNAAENRPGPDRPPAGFEHAVRGGSWANQPELVKVYTRASQPGDWCTPYLGFRPVLARP
jgi:iron(II)-dependent oxidoreductase